jgi:hypothetical protein
MRGDGGSVQMQTYLKTHKIGAEHAIKDLLSPWKASENLAAGKWRMDEKPNVCIWSTVTNHARNKEQMIVMDPNQIARLEDRKDRVCVGLICLLIGREPFVLYWNF